MESAGGGFLQPPPHRRALTRWGSAGSRAAAQAVARGGRTGGAGQPRDPPLQCCGAVGPCRSADGDDRGGGAGGGIPSGPPPPSQVVFMPHPPRHGRPPPSLRPPFAFHCHFDGGGDVAPSVLPCLLLCGKGKRPECCPTHRGGPPGPPLMAHCCSGIRTPDPWGCWGRGCAAASGRGCGPPGSGWRGPSRRRAECSPPGWNLWGGHGGTKLHLRPTAGVGQPVPTHRPSRG